MRLLIAAALLVVFVAPARSQDTRDHREAMRHLRLGEDSMRLEQWESAEAEFRSAIRLEPSLEMAHYHLGQVYMATRRYPAAVRAYLGCRDAFVISNRQRSLGDLQAQRGSTIRSRPSRTRRRRWAVAAATSSAAASSSWIGQIADLRALQRQIEVRIRDSRLDLLRPRERLLPQRRHRRCRTRIRRGASRLDPKLGEIHNNLAVVYLQTGRYGKRRQRCPRPRNTDFKVNPQLKADSGSAMGRS